MTRRVIVHASTDLACPDALRHTARFLDGAELLPVVFFAPTAGGARRKANEWWAAERAKVKAQTDRRAAATAKRAASV